MESYKIVYCIIVTYNAMPWVDKCLGSLASSAIPVIPLIVDNCSSDDTVNYITENYQNAIIIENDSNKGFGQANNQGVEYAYQHNTEFFFLLNQDAYIYPDTVSKLVNALIEYPLYVASPIHLNKDGSLLDGGFSDGLVFSHKNIQFVSDLVLHQLKPFYEVEFVNAAAWMISRKCVEQIGGFDPIFFHYGEDVNYCQRLKFHTKKIGVVPNAFIHHCRKDNSVGNPVVFNERVYEMNLLINIADINTNSGFYCQFRRQIRKICYLIFHGQFASCRKLLYACISVISQKKRIEMSIRSNRQIKSNWLKL